MATEATRNKELENKVVEMWDVVKQEKQEIYEKLHARFSAMQRELAESEDRVSELESARNVQMQRLYNENLALRQAVAEMRVKLEQMGEVCPPITSPTPSRDPSPIASPRGERPQTIVMEGQPLPVPANLVQRPTYSSLPRPQSVVGATPQPGDAEATAKGSTPESVESDARDSCRSGERRGRLACF